MLMTWTYNVNFAGRVFSLHGFQACGKTRTTEGQELIKKKTVFGEVAEKKGNNDASFLPFAALNFPTGDFFPHLLLFEFPKELRGRSQLGKSRSQWNCSLFSRSSLANPKRKSTLEATNQKRVKAQHELLAWERGGSRVQKIQCSAVHLRWPNIVRTVQYFSLNCTLMKPQDNGKSLLYCTKARLM